MDKDTVVLVNGCFWHRHQGCYLAYSPKSRQSFWQKKFRDTVKRDATKTRELRRLGWKVLNVWECELDDLNLLGERLSSAIQNSRIKVLTNRLQFRISSFHSVGSVRYTHTVLNRLNEPTRVCEIGETARWLLRIRLPDLGWKMFSPPDDSLDPFATLGTILSMLWLIWSTTALQQRRVASQST